jgi:hypothetical protein
MAISGQQRALPEGRRLAVPFLKASLIASLVFALAFIRWPLSKSPVNLVGICLWYGIPITIQSRRKAITNAIAPTKRIAFYSWATLGQRRTATAATEHSRTRRFGLRYATNLALRI